MPEIHHFKLEPPEFAGPLGCAPVVGGRYVWQDKSAEIVEVTSTHVVVSVRDGNHCFRKSITIEEFPALEQRTFALGAVFKPAQNKQ